MDYTDFFELAKNKGITNIQITEKTTIDSSVEIIDGKIDSYNDTDCLDYSIKAEFNNKTVKANSNYLSEKVLDLLKQQNKKTLQSVLIFII